MHELELAARDVIEVWETGDLADAVTRLNHLLDNQHLNRTECGTAIARAREMYADDHCVIDESPMVAPAEDGAYIAAWLWVPNL